MSETETESVALVRFDRMCQAIAEAKSVDEVKAIHDKAVAAQAYARQAKMGLEAQNDVAEIRLRAERRAGELLKELKRNPGARTDLTSLQPATRFEQQIAEIGIEKTAAHRWQREADIPPEIFEEKIAEMKRAGQELTTASMIKVAKELELEQAKQEHAERQRGAAQQAIVYHQDALSFLADLPDASIDLLLTDPPYMTDVDDISTFARTWLPVALRKIKPTGRGYVCIGPYPAELKAYLDMAISAPITLANILVWTYENTLGPQPTFDYKLNWQAILYFRGASAPPLDCPQMIEQFTVQPINAPDGRINNRYHRWQKPDALAERFIRHSTVPGQTVIDPFAGTGTFLLAAARLNRIAIGCDKDIDMLAIAQKRGCICEMM